MLKSGQVLIWYSFLFKILDLINFFLKKKVLLYKVQSGRNFVTPISQLKLEIGERSKKLYKASLNPNDLQIYLLRDFKVLNLFFGLPDKNRMLSYKRSGLIIFFKFIKIFCRN